MKSLISFLVFLVILIFCFIGSWHLLGIRKKTFVQDISQVPFMQAVLLTKEGPEFLLGQEEIEGFLSAHTDATFLIPPQDQKTILERLNDSLKRADRAVSLHVEPIAEGQQLVEVFLHGDPSDYILGYEATAKKITPKYYIRFSVFDVMLVSVVSLLPAILIHEVSRRYLRARLNKVSTTD